MYFLIGMGKEKDREDNKQGHYRFDSVYWEIKIMVPGFEL